MELAAARCLRDTPSSDKAVNVLRFENSRDPVTAHNDASRTADAGAAAEPPDPVSPPRARERAAAATQVAMLILDEGGSIRWCSRSACQAFGRSRDELSGTAIRALIPALALGAKTPGYNVAYVTFWFAGGRSRLLRGIDEKGLPFTLDVSVAVMQPGPGGAFVVGLRQHGEADSPWRSAPWTSGPSANA
jgi:hypothetical protein